MSIVDVNVAPIFQVESKLGWRSGVIGAKRYFHFVRCLSLGENDGRRQGRTQPALVAAFYCLLQRSPGASVHSQRAEDRHFQIGRCMMLLAPDVPVIGLDAPGAGGFLDPRLVREIWWVLNRAVL